MRKLLLIGIFTTILLSVVACRKKATDEAIEPTPYITNTPTQADKNTSEGKNNADPTVEDDRVKRPSAEELLLWGLSEGLQATIYLSTDDPENEESQMLEASIFYDGAYSYLDGRYEKENAEEEYAKDIEQYYRINEDGEAYLYSCEDGEWAYTFVEPDAEIMSRTSYADTEDCVLDEGDGELVVTGTIKSLGIADFLDRYVPASEWKITFSALFDNKEPYALKDMDIYCESYNTGDVKICALTFKLTTCAYAVVIPQEVLSAENKKDTVITIDSGTDNTERTTTDISFGEKEKTLGLPGVKLSDDGTGKITIEDRSVDIKITNSGIAVAETDLGILFGLIPEGKAVGAKTAEGRSIYCSIYDGGATALVDIGEETYLKITATGDDDIIFTAITSLFR